MVVAQAVNTELAFCVPTAELTLRPVHGMDPDLGLVEVHGTVPKDALAPEVVPRPGRPRSRWPSWPSATSWSVPRGRCSSWPGSTPSHASSSGSPSPGFQAVRHRLAETLVAIEAADAVLDAAWEDRSPVTAAVAKALAGRGARTASRHCQQVLAGIGFTTEHEFHRYARRVLVLDELFGASRALTRDLGADLLSTRRLPAFAPL